MSVTIFEPGKSDRIPSPVTVLADYSFANAFNLTCKVGATAAPSQHHTNGGGRHTSAAISVPPGVYTVHADGDNSAGGDAQPEVVITGEKGPIEKVEVKDKPTDVSGTKTVKVTGECDPRTKAAYVICRVFEVNMKTKVRTRVAAGAATTEGKKLTWKVVVSFRCNQGRRTEYVAQITSYNLQDQPQGQITKYIKK